MLKRTHVITGVAITMPFIIYNPIAVVGLVGSYAPDFDIKLGIKHRTITHSFLMLATTTFLISFLSSYVAFVWCMNYLLHLLTDSLTVSGVPFLYPFSKKTYGLKIFKSGKMGDHILQLLSLGYMYLLYLK